MTKFPNREGLQAVNAENRTVEALQGNYVDNGVEVSTDGTDMTLDVASGTIVQDNEEQGIGATTVTVPDNTEDEPRKDIVYVDDTQSVEVATGASESPEPALEDVDSVFHTAQPSPPSLVNQDDVVVLAEVWVEDGATEIEEDELSDRRLFLGLETEGSNHFTATISQKEFQDGLDNSEIFRFPLESGEKFSINRFGVYQRGGGSTDTDFSMRVIEETGSELVSTDLNNTEFPDVESSEGAVILIEVSNSTASNVQSNYVLEGDIVG